jgi:hypothetical protein
MKNLIEILKNVPEGTKLYSTIHGDIYFDHIDATNIYPIKCHGNVSKFNFTKDGKHYHDYDGECILFPSKKQRDWSQFKVPCQFKPGDVLTSNDGLYITIFNKKDCLPMGGESNVLYYNCYYDTKFSRLEIGINYGIGRIIDYHYANSVEKNILFDRLQEKGYFWNDKTNSLEKYKFKIGDKIQNINTKNRYKVIGVNYDYYTLENKCVLDCSDQNKFENVKFDITTLKPYDEVLVRDIYEDYWRFATFGFYKEFGTHPFHTIGGIGFDCCIPYKGNEHLTGTTNDCDEYYKTWE